MKQNPDSYLLYECGKFITFNIRLKLVMRDEVNPTALNTAAQKAFTQKYHRGVTTPPPMVFRVQ